RPIHELGLCCARDRISVDNSSALCMAKQQANDSPVVCSALRRIRERSQPVVEFIDGDPRYWPLPEVLDKFVQPVAQIEQINLRAPVPALRFGYFIRELRDGYSVSAHPL